ncbi:type III secretion protein, partial [Vibrio cholerae]|nr:type III secretion protein [Vibrio cholerae]
MKYPKLNFKLSIFSLIITLLLPTIILISLPGGMIDTLIVFSFISSFLLLVIMLENDQPLKVTFLPTIVLLLTTFRLLLSIATTRNIIANDDVGQVIETVGNTVMGGNLISGLLIFTIITIVQFLVVTKGGERVAEVGARFSLDAMPGRQMTIDGDLKAGLISPHQAQRLRSELSTENKLFGSLDGAMKFIKGDAIAGILISFVNLFGGIYVGINQFNLTFSDSIAKFSVLTIGDGLVSQIPSLILSLACGVYLTRIKGADDSSTSFSSQLFSQIKSFWKSLITIGFLLLVIGILNYNLIYVFFPFALS